MVVHVRPKRSVAGDALRSGSTSTVGNLGARVRELRRGRSWNLSELSKRSGIALSTLSKVENGMLSLTYDRLQQVARAFDMSLSEFIAPASAEKGTPLPSARISWARRGSGTVAETSNYRYTYLCDNLRLKSMVPIVSICHATTMEEFGPLLKHDAEEFIFVLKGRVEVHTEYYSPEILEEHEGVYLDSRMGHAYLNAGDGEALILSINHDT